MDIQQLHPDLQPQLNDLLPLWNTKNGMTKKVSLASVQTLMNEGITLPGGILAASTISLMRARPVSPASIALTATPTPFNPFQIGVQNPPLSSNSAFAYNLATGQFVAQRQIALAQFGLSMIGNWGNGVNLTLQAWIGPTSNPYNLTPSFIDIGTATPRTANFGGVVGNPNNINNVINAGDVFQLAGALSTPGDLSLSSIVMYVQSLDGV